MIIVIDRIERLTDIDKVNVFGTYEINDKVSILDYIIKHDDSEFDNAVLEAYGEIAQPALISTDVLAEYVTVEDVKEERQRRIYAIADPDAQAFYMRTAIALNNKALNGILTDEEQYQLDRIEAGNRMIDFIVAKANEIELMDPIPLDYTDDSYWT